MTTFTPISSIIGGALIGFSALLLLYQGKICGISGIFRSFLTEKPSLNQWRSLFIWGLFTGGLTMYLLLPHTFLKTSHTSPLSLIVGGFLVGVGTTLGNGCTSGHGVCGMGRFSPRSLIASIIFLAFGILTASLIGYINP